MRKIIRTFSLLSLLLVPLLRADSLARWPDNVHEIRLANGMKFLLYRRGEAPIFSASIRFRTGGIDEDEGKTGLAHFMEHMAFKGTGSLDETGLARLVEENGGNDFNATTSKDMTDYVVSFPADKFRFWAELESERIFHPVFRDFEKEKAVVLEERKMRVDNDPDGRLYEALLQTAFQKSPYRWMTIGKEADVQALTERDLEEFWQKHYHPSNAVGTVVGRLDLKEAEKILQETFGRVPFEGQKPGEASYPSEPPQTRERRIEMRQPARPRLWVAFHKPTLPHPDDYIFDLLNDVLGEGRSSRLYKSLVSDRKIASNVETSTGVPGSRLPNLFMIEVDLLGNHSPEEALKILDREIEGIKKEGVTEKEVEKARNRLSIGLVWGMKTNDGLASQLSYYEIVAGSWRYLADYLDQLARFKPEDLRRVAKTYLTANNRTVAILRP